MKKLGRVAAAALQDFVADRCPQQAAGIAYRALFSMAPLAIVLVAIFGLVLQDDGIRETVVDTVVDALPVSAAGHQDVEDAITAIATPASALGLLGLLVFLWAATGMMAAIRQGLESALHVTDSRPMLRAKLIDLALVAGAGLLVLISAGVTLLGVLVDKASDDVADATGIGADALATVGHRGASFILSTVVVLLLYRFVPARGLRVRDGVVGAIVTALLLQLISLASAWIYEKTTELSVIYGSLTAVLVFLYSLYLFASALLLGAEVAAAWCRPHTESGEGGPILTQLKRAGRGLFARQKT